MALSEKQLQDVCCLYTGYKQCRYLVDEYDSGGKHVYICKKLSPEKESIDDELVDLLNDFKKSNTDPKQSGVPMKDNCTGYLPLIEKKQGYDVK